MGEEYDENKALKVLEESEKAKPAKVEKKPPPPYPFNFVTRKEWGAAKATGRHFPIEHPTEFYMYTFSNTEPCMTRGACLTNILELQKHHMTVMGYNDIAYNFVIGGDLTVYEGRGWFVKPQAITDRQKEYEGKYISIGYMGFAGAGIERNFYCVEIIDLRDELVQYGIDQEYVDEHAMFDRIDTYYE